jgi:hypothetical protein
MREGFRVLRMVGTVYVLLAVVIVVTIVHSRLSR